MPENVRPEFMPRAAGGASERKRAGTSPHRGPVPGKILASDDARLLPS
jgi:hypothetical protein